MQTEILANIANTNEGIFSMILNASLVVKIVIGILLLMSIWVWGVILEKFAFLNFAEQRMKSFEKEFWSGKPLEELYKKVAKSSSNPLVDVFKSGMREWIKISGNPHNIDAKIVAERSLQQMYSQSEVSVMNLEKGLSSLASIGSASPFIGLFGTVIGVMNSFQSIAISKDTSLAVVAPGIAEALFVTALGLFVAIPATIAFNSFSQKISEMNVKITYFANDFSALIWRRLEKLPKNN